MLIFLRNILKQLDLLHSHFQDSNVFLKKTPQKTTHLRWLSSQGCPARLPKWHFVRPKGISWKYAGKLKSREHDYTNPSRENSTWREVQTHGGLSSNKHLEERHNEFLMNQQQEQEIKNMQYNPNMDIIKEGWEIMFNQAQQQIVNLMTTNKHNKYKLLIRSYMGISQTQRKRIRSCK